ncbi:hypothetical protein CSAL01_08348 [Colletotrichum salicis]|uniref:Tryptophan synthase beta chain-like PALP domain-containing protein n=1 Tax=Colletotrichum salicis TaxID=1209931 RepID=A0A135UMC6_9PEZI|nr:hypothetical protein CSAL01_08348 [Colletotrichum salicis]
MTIDYSHHPNARRLFKASAKTAATCVQNLNESRRFGTDLGSFKALGAPFAVYRILADEVHRQTGAYPSSAELRTSKYHHITQQVTVCVATDGNQGRELAYGAKVFGCRCVDYIHGHGSPVRAKMMMDLGAIVIRIDG